MALAFVPPFELPTAAGELAGGVFAEYTGVRLAILRLGRLLLVLTLALAVVVFFLGGWLGALLPGWAWTSAKTLGVAALMLAVGRYVPRVSTDALLAWAWKLGIPLALVNILWVGLTLLGVRG
jgi:NADH-quinone oxidoreductase subunit H